jgi:hypothetical protein
MRKQLSALSLIIIVPIILSSTSLVKGYTPEINAIGTVDNVIRGFFYSNFWSNNNIS